MGEETKNLTRDGEAFWDRHNPSEYGGGFLSEDQLQELITSGTVLYVSWIDDAEEAKYGRMRTVTFVRSDTGLEVKKSFSIENEEGGPVFEARARMLQDMAEHLVAGGAEIPVRLYYAGQAIGFEKA